MPTEVTVTPQHLLTVTTSNFNLEITDTNWELELTENNWDLTLMYSDGSDLPNAITAATTSDGTCDLSLNSLQVGDGSYYVSITDDGNTYHYDTETNKTSQLNATSLQFSADGETLGVGAYGISTNGSITVADGAIYTQITPSGIVTTGDITVSGTIFANHIHGNIAGNVYTHVRAGEALTKGDPVYVSGSHGSGSTVIPIVSRADASNQAKMPAIGIVDADIAHNANGHMVIIGAVTEINTNAYSINDTLYVAAGGGLTATPPTLISQAVARVERKNTNNGSILVKINDSASIGGNGTADSEKLVRFNSTGLVAASAIGIYHQVASAYSSTSEDYYTLVSVTLPAGVYQLDASLADIHSTSGCKIKLLASSPIKANLSDSYGRPSVAPLTETIASENFTQSEKTNAVSPTNVEFRRTLTGIIVINTANTTVSLQFAQLTNTGSASSARYGTHIIARRLNG